MPFSEATKLEAKRRAHFSCVVCHQPFVEVHHILPQAAGGSDDLDNAAPLCSSCHDLFGGNPDKRKQIREMRDLWYELCETRFRDSPTLKLAEAVDEIKGRQHEQGALLSDIKHLLGSFYTNQSQYVMAASTTQQLASLSGVTIPPDYIRNRGKKRHDDRSEIEQRILLLLAESSTPIRDDELVRQLGIGQRLADHHVGELLRADYIFTEATYDEHSHW
jgi:HNH endonuclease